MNYGQWHQIFTNKVKAYDWYTCRRAMLDCHDTLALHKDLATDDAYYIKLWAEIDALRERQLFHSKRCVKATHLHGDNYKPVSPVL